MGRPEINIVLCKKRFVCGVYVLYSKYEYQIA